MIAEIVGGQFDGSQYMLPSGVYPGSTIVTIERDGQICERGARYLPR